MPPASECTAFGFDLSYSPLFSRRITQNSYVRFRGKVLHQIKNQRLGKGIIRGTNECHAYFPHLPVPDHGDTHLSTQQRLWIDRIILPALCGSCPNEIRQHYPRSFAELQAKAHAREEIHVTGSGQAMEVQHVILDRYLDAFWADCFGGIEMRGWRGSDYGRVRVRDRVEDGRAEGAVRRASEGSKEGGQRRWLGEGRVASVRA